MTFNVTGGVIGLIGATKQPLEISGQVGTIVSLEFGADWGRSIPPNILLPLQSAFGKCGVLRYFAVSIAQIEIRDSCIVNFEFPEHDVNRNGVPDKNEQALRLFSVKSSDSAIWEDELGTKTITVEAYMTGVQRRMYVLAGGGSFELNDSGILGDSIAGDRVYTAKVQIPKNTDYSPVMPGVREVPLHFGQLDIDGTIRSIGSFEGANSISLFPVKILDRNKVAFSKPKILEAGIVAGQRFVARQTFGDHYYQGSWDALLEKYLSTPVNFKIHLPLGINISEGFYTNGGYFSGNSNATGVVPGRTYSVPDSPQKTGGFIYLGPFFQNFEALNHEVGHTWGFFLCSKNLDLCRDVGHPTTSTLDSALTYGIKLVVGPCTGAFKIVNSHRQYFGQLDLRNMGLALEEEIPDFIMLNNKGALENIYDCVGARGAYALADTTLVTYRDIVNEYGRRIPAYDSAKEYSWSSVALVTANRMITDAESSYFDHAMKHWERRDDGECPRSNLSGRCFTPFWAATSGRASIRTAVQLKSAFSAISAARNSTPLRSDAILKVK